MIATFDNVAKWYGDVIGLVDVTTEIGPGVTALLGPNGAGKSTFLKLLTGQLVPSTGSVSLFGKNPFRSSGVYRQVGFCPEQDAFYEDMTGRKFVHYLTRLHGYGAAEARRRSDEAIERVGMSENAHRRIRTYSKWMRQRIKLAQAISHDPQLVVLDEPLNGMDPIGRRKVIDLVKEMGAEGRSVLVSSHILHEVEAMTRELLLLYQGRVLAEGTVEEIRAYLNQYPHKIIVRAPRAREIAGHLLKLDGVSGVRIDNETLHIEAQNPDQLFDALPELVLQQGFDLDAVEASDVSLEAIFDYLVK